MPSRCVRSVRALGAADDLEAERAVGITEGSLKRIRRLPGRAFAVARVGDEVAGLVAYDPVTSSTSVLRARTPAMARALLQAVRPACPPERESVRLNIDGDDALCAAVVTVGGRVVMRTWRMEGALPVRSTADAGGALP